MISPINSTYVIELEKFNIVPGLIGHKAPYSINEWERANNNYEGIRNALNYANQNGYTEVILPRNDYVFCYRNPSGTTTLTLNTEWVIVIPSNLKFNLNSSRIFIIYDSENKNPYDKSPSNNPAYKLPGRVFKFSGTHNSTICNGEIVGDLYERSFTNSLENMMDITSGIVVEQTSTFCKINNMKIHGFMADAITGNSNHHPRLGSQLPYDLTRTFYPGNIDNKGSLMSIISGAYSTDFIPLDNILTEELIMRTNIGYVRIPEFSNQNLTITFYDVFKGYILQEDFTYLQLTKKPRNAKYIKLTCYDEQVGLASKQFTFQITPPVSSNLVIEDCDIFNNHRGGIANIVNNTIIQRCKIHENGQGRKDGFPEFKDTTRYAINNEDVVSNKVTIRDNEIYDHFNGILASVLDLEVYNNTFTRMNSTVVFYSGQAAKIHNNKYYSCGSILGTNHESVLKNMIVHDNILLDTDLGQTGSESHSIILENNIVHNYKITLPQVTDISGLIYHERFHRNQFVNRYLKGIVRDSVFNFNFDAYSTSRFIIDNKKHSKGIRIQGQKGSLSFQNAYGIIVNSDGMNFSVPDNGDVTIEDCSLRMKGISINLFGPNDITKKIVIKNTKITPLTQLFSLGGNSNQGIKDITIVFENCLIEGEITTASLIKATGLSGPSHKLKVTFINCIFNLYSKANIPIFYGGMGGGVDFNFIKCTFLYNQLDTTTNRSNYNLNIEN